MKKHHPHLVIALLFFFLLILPSGLGAAPYYQGKKITIVVGFAPGGGYDRMTRMLVKHLPRFIPGKPTFIVENMPGGSSMIAANHVYRVAKPDGLTIGNINQGLQIAQLIKIEGMEFDLKKFAWIGSTGSDSKIFCIRTDLPYKTFAELKNAKKPVFMASSGPMGSSSQFVNLIREFIKLDIQDITYTNAPATLLAVERKEVDGTAATYVSLKQLIDRGLLRPLLRGRVSEPGVENLPVDEDLTTDKIGKKIMAMRSATDRIGRPYVAPPGTPKEPMDILKNAFAQVVKDPQLLADAKKNTMPIAYLSAEESLKSINYLLNQPEDIVKEFKKYIKY